MDKLSIPTFSLTRTNKFFSSAIFQKNKHFLNRDEQVAHAQHFSWPWKIRFILTEVITNCHAYTEVPWDILTPILSTEGSNLSGSIKKNAYALWNQTEIDLTRKSGRLRQHDQASEMLSRTSTVSICSLDHEASPFQLTSPPNLKALCFGSGFSHQGSETFF